MAVNVKIGDNGVGEVELAWPERRNALGPSEADELKGAIEVATARGVGAIVLSAAGPAFCAGGDLAAIVKLIEGGEGTVRSTIYASFQGLFRSILDCPVPLLAAVDGPAVGLGSDLALACGVTYVGERGWLRQGWAALGLIPAPGGVEYVRRRGGSAAVWRFTAASRLDGIDAERLGLALSVPDARASARETAQALADLPLGVVRATQELLRYHELDDHLRVALDYQVDFLCSAAFTERAAKVLSGIQSTP